MKSARLGDALQVGVREREVEDGSRSHSVETWVEKT